MYGAGNLKLSSTDVDNLRTQEERDARIFNCERKNIDVARIQEKHNGGNDTQG